jgi:polyphosphate kinase
MPRNLDRRIEIMFPLEDEDIRQKAMHILTTELEDTEQAQVMNKDGIYERVDRRGKDVVNSQLQFGREAAKTAEAAREAKTNTRVFTPEKPPEA